MTNRVKLETTAEPGVYRRVGRYRTSYLVIVPNGIGPDGKPKQLKRSLPDFETAKAHRARVIHEQRAGEYVEPSRELFGDYLMRYCDGFRGHVKPSTVRTYRDHVKRMAPLHTKRLSQLTPALIQRWMTALQDSGIAANTTVQTYHFLKRSLADAVKFHLIPANPCTPLRTPKVADYERPRFDTDELAAFRASIRDDPKRVIWETFIETGIRYGELAALRWDAVDLDKRVILIRETQTRTEAGGRTTGSPKSPAGQRPIAISINLAAMLRAHRVLIRERQLLDPRWNSDNLVFPNLYGNRQDNGVLNEALANACAAAKVKIITTHGFRHTNGAQMDAAGISPAMMKQRLGHERISTTFDLYVRPDQRQHEQAIDRFSAFLGASNAKTIATTDNDDPELPTAIRESSKVKL